MADNPRFNLGVLRSAMHLTLHTRQAARIWQGRARSDDRTGIIGLDHFVRVMNWMKRGAEQDDPYSDFWMLCIEAKLEDAKQGLQLLRGQTDRVLADVPPALTLGENVSVLPVQIPLFVGTQHGFLAIYLLIAFDDLARRLLLAHHTALIDQRTMFARLDEGAFLLRSIFSVAQRYRYCGACRDDFAANNAVARAARQRLGELPQDVLEGTRRPRFAPRITRRSPLRTADEQADSPSDTAAPAIDESSLDDLNEPGSAESIDDGAPA